MFKKYGDDKRIFWYVVFIEIIVEIIILFLLFIISHYKRQINQVGLYNNIIDEEKKYIKWVDFNVTSEAMKKAYTYDKESYGSNAHIKWVELLAFLGCKYGGDFKKYKSTDMEEIVDRIKNNEKMDEITLNMKYYDYYFEAYDAVLGGLVGLYQEDGNKEKKYGLKGFFPLAKNYPFNHYDDFGVSREYGYKRRHLGHDIMGQVGTPVINVESGYVEALGWNRYGGWRIGIRSFDKKRYYYYAHLRKNFPFNKSIKIGSKVTSGQVIGYMGQDIVIRKIRII